MKSSKKLGIEMALNCIEVLYKYTNGQFRLCRVRPLSTHRFPVEEEHTKEVK